MTEMADYPPELDCFFNPKAIAIIGASASPTSTGYALVANLVNLGFQGEVYHVNPRSGDVLGIRTYPSISHVPPGVDLAIIAVRSPLVSEVVQQCGDSGVKAAMIVSDGFADGDEEGRKLQQIVVQIAKRYGIRIVGPNTQGFLNMDNRLLALTGSALPPESLKRDEVSFIAQTGLFMGGWTVRSMRPGGIGVSKTIDLGNMCDIDHKDVLAYLGADPATQVIVIYMDMVGDGSEFIKAARQVTPYKPVIVVKPGKSPAARQAMLSHTGSLAGDDNVFEAVCRQTGIVRAADVDEVEDLVGTFLYLPPLSGKRIGIIAFSGATGIIAADACAQFGLEVTELSGLTIDKIAATLPSWGSVNNPVDFMQAFEVDMTKTLTTAVEALLADPKIDGIVLIVVVMSTPPIDVYLNIIKELGERELNKPISLWALGDEDSITQIQGLPKKGLVYYPSITRAVKALAASYSRYRYLDEVTQFAGTPDINMEVV